MCVFTEVVVASVVDAASGALVAAQAHRRARALALAVHTDHYVAYLYYNDKHRRTEIGHSHRPCHLPHPLLILLLI